VANYGDALAGIRIDNIAVEHVFLFCASEVTFTTPKSPRCSGCRAIFPSSCQNSSDPARAGLFCAFSVPA
jgi:hypothetical protein